MSAILKALRKIELESSSEVLGRSFPNKIDAGRVINQRAKNEWVFRRLVRVFIPVLVLAAAVLLVIAFKPSLSKDPVFFSPVPQVHGKEEKVKDFPAPARRREYAQAPGGAAKEPTAPAGSAALDSWTGSAPLQDRPSAFRKDLEAGTPSFPAQTRSQAGSDRVLELQAIVWSDNPASCFAVINGRIVRSGGMVDGVSVVEIGSEAVSLKLGDKSWTLRMLEGDR